MNIYICVCVYIYIFIYLIVKITSLVTIFKTKPYFNIIHSFDLIFENATQRGKIIIVIISSTPRSGFLQ